MKKTSKSVSVKTLEKSVRAGIKWLDKNKPGWHKDIRLKELDLNDGAKCIVGQAIGDFWRGIAQHNLNEKRAALLGFTLLRRDYSEYCDPVFEVLTGIWHLRIAEIRLKEAA